MYVCMYNEKNHFTAYIMQRLDMIRSSSNITCWNYIPTCPNMLTLLTLKIKVTI